MVRTRTGFDTGDPKALLVAFIAVLLAPFGGLPFVPPGPRAPPRRSARNLPDRPGRTTGDPEAWRRAHQPWLRADPDLRPRHVTRRWSLGRPPPEIVRSDVDGVETFTLQFTGGQSGFYRGAAGFEFYVWNLWCMALRRMFTRYVDSVVAGDLTIQQALLFFKQHAPTFREWALQLEYEDDDWRAVQWEDALAAAEDPVALWILALDLLERYGGGPGTAAAAGLLTADMTGVPAALLLDLIKTVLGLPRCAETGRVIGRRSGPVFATSTQGNKHAESVSPDATTPVSFATSICYGDFVFVGCWVNIARGTSELPAFRAYCRALYDNRDRITTYMEMDWSQIVDEAFPDERPVGAP